MDVITVAGKSYYAWPVPDEANTVPAVVLDPPVAAENNAEKPEPAASMEPSVDRCPTCNRKVHDLARHNRMVHEDNGDRISCVGCQKTYANRSAYLVHIKKRDCPGRKDELVQKIMDLEHDLEEARGLRRASQEENIKLREEIYRVKDFPVGDSRQASPDWKNEPRASSWIENVRRHHEELSNVGRGDIQPIPSRWPKESPEKKHVCLICGKAFAYKSVLQDHLRRHMGEKSFVCVECGASFVTKAELTSHGFRKHTTDTQKA